jgi:hypothetical protein
VLLGEMFPNRIRGTALAVAASAQWVANFADTRYQRGEPCAGGSSRRPSTR